MKKVGGCSILLIVLFNISYAVDLGKNQMHKVSNVSISTRSSVSNIKKESTIEKDKKIEEIDLKNDVSNNSYEKESGVIIDKNFEYKTDEKYDEKEINNENIVPYSFGVLRGTLNMDGKSVLVFESDEVIYFVIVYKEKDTIKWKLYGKLVRG